MSCSVHLLIPFLSTHSDHYHYRFALHALFLLQASTLNVICPIIPAATGRSVPSLLALAAPSALERLLFFSLYAVL